MNYCDPSGHFAILACILGITALIGMGLTIGGVATDNNLMTGIGLTMVAVPALISGGMAVACLGAWGTMAIGWYNCYRFRNWIICFCRISRILYWKQLDDRCWDE